MAFLQTYKLNTKIEIQQSRPIKDAYGTSLVWETFMKPWASVQTHTMRDMVSSAGTVLDGSTVFVIRYQQRAQVQRNQRVVWQGKTYNIERVAVGEFNKDFTTIVCKEVDK